MMPAAIQEIRERCYEQYGSAADAKPYTALSMTPPLYHEFLKYVGCSVSIDGKAFESVILDCWNFGTGLVKITADASLPPPGYVLS